MKLLRLVRDTLRTGRSSEHMLCRLRGQAGAISSGVLLLGPCHDLRPLHGVATVPFCFLLAALKSWSMECLNFGQRHSDCKSSSSDDMCRLSSSAWLQPVERPLLAALKSWSMECLNFGQRHSDCKSSSSDDMCRL